mmetsp:Transcript_8423/g.25976  ORF Transcript_8423/g.25976 Transcript_8423/m.25976 type:complete len:207 (-) Transcript_8423:229-849(-)
MIARPDGAGQSRPRRATQASLARRWPSLARRAALLGLGFQERPRARRREVAEGQEQAGHGCSQGQDQQGGSCRPGRPNTATQRARRCTQAAGDRGPGAPQGAELPRHGRGLSQGGQDRHVQLSLLGPRGQGLEEHCGAHSAPEVRDDPVEGPDVANVETAGVLQRRAHNWSSGETNILRDRSAGHRSVLVRVCQQDHCLHPSGLHY